MTININLTEIYNIPMCPALLRSTSRLSATKSFVSAIFLSLQSIARPEIRVHCLAVLADLVLVLKVVK